MEQDNHNVAARSDRKLERQMLGAIITDPNILPQIRDLISAECFYDAENRKVWDVIERLEHEGKPYDLMALTMYGIEHGGDELKPVVIADIAGNALHNHIFESADLLRTLMLQRRMVQFGLKCVQFGSEPIVESIDGMIDSMKRKMDTFMETGDSGILNLKDAQYEFIAKINRMRSERNDGEGTMTGFSFFDNFGGLHPTDLIIIAGETSFGKALRMDEPILTPKGWVPNKDIKVGDYVCSIDGEESKVLGVYPQGLKPMYCITFSDGRKSYCSGDHLWEIGSSVFKSGNRVLTTTQIKEMQDNHVAFHNRMYVPMFSGKYGDRKKFVIHPYVLGVLIGDGCLTKGVAFVAPDEFVINKVRSLCDMPISSTYSKNRVTTYRITNGYTGHSDDNVYLNEIKRLGLYGCKSHDKFIPEEYYDCCYEQRMELMNGLVDTDGEVSKTGAIVYSSVSKRLAEDVARLAYSLGMKASVLPHHTEFNGKVFDDHYRVTISGENESEVATLPRKAERLVSRKRVKNCIRSVEYIGDEECQCIRVSHPRALFVIGGYIMTHNTSFANSIALNAANSGSRICYYSMEMSVEQMASRFISLAEDIRSSKMLYKPTELNDWEMRHIGKAVNKSHTDNIFLFDRSQNNIKNILIGIRTMKAKHDIHGAIIDYIGLIKTDPSSRQSEAGKLNDIARDLKNIAKELGIWIIAISQMSRNNENKDSHLPSINQLKGSGGIAEAADDVILLYRPEKRYPNERFPHPNEMTETKGKALILIEKKRNGEVGNFICDFVGDRTLFIEDKRTIEYGKVFEASKKPAAKDENGKEVNDNMPF